MSRRDCFNTTKGLPSQPPRSYSSTKSLQPKMVGGVRPPRAPQMKSHPVAPKVYHPQPTPKVLQAKAAGNRQPQIPGAERKPVAPPIYKPEQRKIIQPKMALQPRKSPVAPPVYCPEKKRIVQPKMGVAMPQGKGQNVASSSPAGRQTALKNSASTLRRTGAFEPASLSGRPSSARQMVHVVQPKAERISPLMQAKRLATNAEQRSQGARDARGRTAQANLHLMNAGRNTAFTNVLLRQRNVLQRMVAASSTTGAEDDEVFDFNQKQVLGEEVCYGMALTWIRKRAAGGSSGSREIRLMTGESELATTGKELHKQYIPNDKGKGPILDTINQNREKLERDYGLPSRASGGHEVGKHLSGEDAWQKNALNAARLLQHLKLEKEASGLERLARYNAINFNPTSFQSKLKGLMDFVSVFRARFFILVLDGSKSGHAIAVEKQDKNFYFFDPDLGQRVGDIEVVKSRVVAINELLNLHSMEVEPFK